MLHISLKTKIFLIYGFGIGAVVFVLTTYTLISNRQLAIEAARNEVVFAVGKYSALISAEIKNGMEVSKTISSTFATLKKDNRSKIDREMAVGLLKQMLIDHPFIFGVGSYWYANSFDGNDKAYARAMNHDETGRFVPYLSRNKKGEINLEYFVGYNISDLETKKVPELVIDPYNYKVRDQNILMISLITPVIINNKFQAAITVDMPINFLQKLAINAKKEIYKGEAEVSVISNKGVCTACTLDSQLIGKKLSKFVSDSIVVLNGKETITNSNGKLQVCVPIQIGKTISPWQILVTVPLDSITKSANFHVFIQILISLFLIFVCVFSMYLVLMRSLKPLFELTRLTKEVAMGKLNVIVNKTDRKDEVGELTDSFDRMIKKIQEIVLDIRAGANKIVKASSQIATLAQTIAYGANEQAASTEQISASVEEMTASINQNTENARITEKTAIKASSGIIRASSAFDNSIVAMQEIADKLFVITQIANKTDFLAINASIEAARAGVHGKGFSIVAQEVRKLSESTQKAAKIIEDVIHNNSRLVFSSVEMLREIVPDVEMTSKLVQEISVSSLEQYSGSDQINTAVQELNNVTQANAYSAEELASSAEELADQSIVLNTIISFFSFNEANDIVKSPTDHEISYLKKYKK